MNKRKRNDYISWDEYFMASAALAAQRSKDPITQVGACIVNSENKIVGVGYNSFPSGCSDDDFSWARRTPNSEEDNKHSYVCHAELNAIMNKNSADLKKCRMYATRIPCSECAKLIIQAGIQRVIYLNDKYPTEKAAKKMFSHAGVTLSQYVLNENKKKRFIIDFDQFIVPGNNQNTEGNQRDQSGDQSDNQPGTSQN